MKAYLFNLYLNQMQSREQEERDEQNLASVIDYIQRRVMKRI